jgi:large subunit ribosomal protein L18
MLKSKTQTRDRRHARIRAKVIGTAARPRLSIYKSNRYLHAQIIDDTKGATLVAGSTRELKADKKADDAALLGTELAKRAKEKGIGAVVFDRGGFRYTGKIARLAEAARAGGLTL